MEDFCPHWPVSAIEWNGHNTLIFVAYIAESTLSVVCLETPIDRVKITNTLCVGTEVVDTTRKVLLAVGGYVVRVSIRLLVARRSFVVVIS